MPYPFFNNPSFAVKQSVPSDISGGLDGNLAPLQLNQEGRMRVDSDTPLDVWAAGDYNSGTNADAPVSYNAPAADSGHVIDGVILSYSGGTVAGQLLIQYGSGPTTVHSSHYVTTGTWIILFRRPKITPAGQSLTVTLKAGGSAVLGEVTVLGHRVALVPGQVSRSNSGGILDFSDPNESGYI